MNRKLLFLGLVLPLALCSTAFQAKPKPKPAQKPPATAPAKGTVQMPGDKGKVGTTYQLGNVDDELHFTLDSVQLETRVKTTPYIILAKGTDRLLILSFTVQNPLKREVPFDYSAFQFTCVSPDDENRDCDSYAYHPDRRTVLSMQMKPAQKLKAFVAFPIHGEGPITKLIVARGSNRPVVRYDLRANAKPMTSVFSADGISLSTTAKAPFGKAFDFGAYDLTVEKVETAEGAVGQYQPGENQQLFTVTVSFTNTLIVPYRLTWGSYVPTLKDENGGDMEWCSDMLTMSTNKTIDRDYDGGETVRAMYVFRGVKGQVPKKLKLFANDYLRTVNIDLP